MESREEASNFARSAFAASLKFAEIGTESVHVAERVRDDDPPNAQLRTLHTLIREKDPDFGGLVRVLDRGRFLWVHPQYVDRFNPGLPDMGGAEEN